MKAVLLARGIEFPFVHDIEALIQVAREAGVELPQAVEDSGALTPYAVEIRYPGYWPATTPDDIDEAIGLAEKVLHWAIGLVATPT